MVFGLFEKKKPQPTFKERVAEFWRWYPQVDDRFYQSVEARRCESLAPEVSKVAEKLLPHLGWVFGPGENGGHSFTVTGEGQVVKQLLAEYWHSQAPQIPGWTFHASRQPTKAEDLKKFAISLEKGESIDLEHFLVKTNVNEEAQKVDIVAWHPLLQKVPADHHYQILFLLLDEALGELGTEMWLGEIKIEPLAAGPGMITLADLPAMIEKANKYYEWKKLSPLQSYSVYQVSEPIDAPRGDTLFGSTCIGSLLAEFLNNGGKFEENPLEGTGAQLAYVAIDGSVIPAGTEVETRGNIEDALCDGLERENSGRTLGGAFGSQFSYIDLLLFDGDNSRRIVEAVLDGLQLRGRSQFKTFM